MSTKDELLAAAEWFDEVAQYDSSPELIRKEKLAAAALRAQCVRAFGDSAFGGHGSSTIMPHAPMLIARL